MTSIILITPITNIKDYKVIDESKIEEREYNSYEDMFTFYNVLNQQSRRSNLMSVSLYDDLIVDGHVQYKILKMLSKELISKK